MSWFSRFKNALHPRRLDDALEEEIQDHLDRRAAAFREDGMSPAEARRRALAAFGNVTRLREESRDIRLSVGLASALQDMRYAWRGMRRNPVFTLAAVLSLGLAMGANTAIYAIVDAAMLRPLPLPESERLVTLAAPALAPLGSGAPGESESFSYPLYRRLRAAAGDTARLALVSRTDRVEAQWRNDATHVEKVVQQHVSSDAFEVLRVTPVLGRLLSVEEDRGPRTSSSVVLSFDYWRRRFNLDPAILGHALAINGREYRIIGVTGKEFFGVEPGKFVDVWLPVMAFDPGVFSNAASRPFHILGRLAQGASREQLRARLQPAFRDHQLELFGRNATIRPGPVQSFGEMDIRVHPGAIGVSEFRRSFARPLWIVLGVAAGILLIACANVAGLLLGRSAARSAEMAVRTSLGAGRSRLVRQLLTESTLLSVLATGLGWLVARVAAPWLVTLFSNSADPVRLAFAMDTRVLVFCAGVCTLAALFFGLLPAWQGASARPMLALRHVGGQAGGLRMGRLFVGIQVAFAFCLVVTGAGFLLSLHNLFAVDTGFDARNVTVLTMRSDLGPKQDGLRLSQQVQSQVAAVSGVEAAAVGWWAIFDGTRRTEQVVLPGEPLLDREEIFYRVSPGYFAALGTPLLEGRDLEIRDTDAVQPVSTVVNRAFQRMYVGDGTALGREFQRTDGARHRVVGVVANAYYGDLRSGPEPIAYFPMKPPRLFTLYVRSTLEPGAVMRLVEHETAHMPPGIHVVDVTTLEALVSNTLSREKLLAGLGGIFACLGLVLAAIGLFGLLNYSVLRRTKEMGIRAALGARRQALVSLVMSDLLGMMAGGLTVGLMGSIAAMTIVRSQLFGIRPAEPVVMAATAAAFVVATSAAAVLPALRAARMDPLVALRQD